MVANSKSAKDLKVLHKLKKLNHPRAHHTGFHSSEDNYFRQSNLDLRDPKN